MRPLDNADWSTLESNCHRPEIQDVIAVAIREGAIRVVPAPNGRIRIIPTGASLRECDVAVPSALPCRANQPGPPRLIRTTRQTIRRWPGSACSGPSN